MSSVCRPVSAMGDQILQLNLGDDDGKTEDREIPEQEWLLLRAQILSMPSESKDAVVKLLQLPKRQQMLLLSAVMDESGHIQATNDSRNAGSSSAGYPPNVGTGYPPRADVGAGYRPNVGAGFHPRADVGAGYRPNVGAGNPPRADVGAGYMELEVILPPGWDLVDGHAKEVVAELGRIAEAGGQDPLQMDLPFRVASTEEFHLGTGNRWFYLLKCTVCNRMAVTKSGDSGGPEHWARVAGWSWKKSWWRICWCPGHRGGHRESSTRITDPARSVIV